MVENHSKKVRDCILRAEECERNAQRTDDPALHQDFLDSARRWRLLARSYEFTERLTRYTYKPTKADEHKT